MRPRLPPCPSGKKIEQKLGTHSLLRDPDIEVLFQHTSFYGQTAEIDSQGRVLLHQRLRDRVGMVGEVEVMGDFDNLQVWNAERLATRLETHRVTPERMKKASDLLAPKPASAPSA